MPASDSLELLVGARWIMAVLHLAVALLNIVLGVPRARAEWPKARSGVTSLALAASSLLYGLWWALGGLPWANTSVLGLALGDGALRGLATAGYFWVVGIYLTRLKEAVDAANLLLKVVSNNGLSFSAITLGCTVPCIVVSFVAVIVAAVPSPGSNPIVIERILLAGRVIPAVLAAAVPATSGIPTVRRLLASGQPSLRRMGRQAGILSGFFIACSCICVPVYIVLCSSPLIDLGYWLGGWILVEAVMFFAFGVIVASNQLLTSSWFRCRAKRALVGTVPHDKEVAASIVGEPAAASVTPWSEPMSGLRAASARPGRLITPSTTIQVASQTGDSADPSAVFGVNSSTSPMHGHGPPAPLT